MFNATLKRSFFILLILTLVGLAGCSNPEEKRTQQIEAALELSKSGSHEEAIQMLEALALNYPNDPEILELMGRIYAQEGDHTMAAFFLEQAHVQKPEDVELLYETYQAVQAAGQPSGKILEKLADLSTETMTKALWVEIGRHRAENNQIEAALEAYLKGVDPDKETPSPETAATIGQLFVKLGNYPQASSWLEIAADNDDPSALTALFGLLQIQLSQKNWSDAEATIARLNKQFPGAVEASQWKQASDEIKRWRTAQQEMKAKLAAEEARKQAAEKAEQEATEIAQSASAESENAQSSDLEAGEGGKSQVVADLEAAEAMANQPAQEALTTGEATGESPAESKMIAFDPSIAITPADPDFSIDVSFDEESTAADTSFSIETDTDTTAAVETFVAEEELPAAPPPVEAPRTLEELLADAGAAEMDRDYKSAIRKYWAAISIANNRADVWNLLSRAYLIDGQLQNADTTAIEAVRLAPREVAYTLDFLRVAQRSRPPEEFLSQLETAYDRFPSSPEITLSLARAHERISKDNFVARNLYLRFVDIAPNHPLRTEAESAAARLR
jgi:tetratricopeptide (TPR) repeat protein